MSQMVDAEGTREPLRTNPDQLSTAKLRFGHVRLTRGTVPLLWGLRIYALLTIFLIGVQIWRPCAPAGERRAADVFTVEEIHV
jgi:hypothetical protein